MTQMVNVLGAEMEIGAPMICSYLLGLPDHYTNQIFTTFYWKSFKNDSVIGVSPVEDYIHHATGLEHICHRVSNGKPIDEPDQLDVYNDTDSKKRVQSKLVKHCFLESHPLYDTHHTVLRPECERSVPNFVGGMLPRKDVGDHEYYCLTMLTLFRPWCWGKDLKIENISWDTSFINFKLLPWQDKIISNFNL
ncbi:hypothetical protein ARMGADRAFT_1046901 [Armillaria gallica]|uniref:Uncharacterized protein n=1 Tax=Armillaria gallica TaxID=47427 RepID=A0A2H3DN89_ARMGA|nr:hypothetical protein ARMGADRAFT_1046901 [Armillaria gallica]